MTDVRARSAWERLIHRWFIEYNPLYLFSAALVLGGVTVMARALVESGNAVVQLGLTGITELYAWALVGGAALLTRIGLRRPGVLLALIAVLYQGDLTLNSENAAYFGLAGGLSALFWLGSFVGKVLALGYALRLRIPLRAVAFASLGALGLVLLPHVFLHGDARVSSMAAGSLAFALVALVLFAWPEVESLVALDGWGKTVLRRGVRAAWLIWATVGLFHYWFWWRELWVSPWALAAIVPLIIARYRASELETWLGAAGTCVAVAIAAPALLSMTASLVAVTLATRAFRILVRLEVPQRPVSPYRAHPQVAGFGFEWVWARPPREACLRLLSGSFFALYLAMASAGGTHVEHFLALDLAFTLTMAIWIWRSREWSVTAPLAALWLHFGVTRGMVSAPGSPLEWGLAAVGAGFALLVGSVGGAWLWQRRERRAVTA